MQVSFAADLARDEKRVEAKDNVKVGEECELSGQIDSEQLHANPDYDKGGETSCLSWQDFQGI